MKSKISLHGSLFLGFLLLTGLVLGGCENSSNSTRTSDLSKGLIAYYPFNGNANDESGSGHNGTVNGATLCADRNGNAKSAYSFDGVDDWISTNFSNVISQGKFTVSFWVKLPEDNDLGEGFPHEIISCGEFDCIIYQKDSVGLRVISSYSRETFISAGRNEWTHIVGTYDGSNIYLYKNGGVQSTVVFQVGPLSNNEPLILSIAHSVEVGEDSRYFKGNIDSIRIYNRVLTAAEVSSLYENDK